MERQAQETFAERRKIMEMQYQIEKDEIARTNSQELQNSSKIENHSTCSIFALFC